MINKTHNQDIDILNENLKYVTYRLLQTNNDLARQQKLFNRAMKNGKDFSKFANKIESLQLSCIEFEQQINLIENELNIF